MASEKECVQLIKDGLDGCDKSLVETRSQITSELRRSGANFVTLRILEELHAAVCDLRTVLVATLEAQKHCRSQHLTGPLMFPGLVEYLDERARRLQKEGR